mmetsp:Transcript_41779/g.67091  ORF Transcript_41779/g.67091 Transcript_41779/m.67091 type:complete len:293 (+) Transcript_41779:47-925(+)
MAKKKNKNNKKAKSQGLQYNQNLSIAQDEQGVLEAQLNGIGLKSVPVCFDGNCLFRSISFNLFGSQGKHMDIREKVVEAIEQDEEHFSLFIHEDESFQDYCQRMREDGEWGGNMELTSLSRLLNCAIVIHSADQPAYVLSCEESPGFTSQVHLAYLDGMHYNSVRSVDDDCTGPAVPVEFDDESDSYVVSNDLQVAVLVLEGKKTKNTKKSKKKDKSKVGPRVHTPSSDVVADVMEQVDCSDRELVVRTLRDMENDVDAVKEYLVTLLGNGRVYTSIRGRKSPVKSNKTVSI